MAEFDAQKAREDQAKVVRKLRELYRDLGENVVQYYEQNTPGTYEQEGTNRRFMRERLNRYRQTMFDILNNELKPRN